MGYNVSGYETNVVWCESITSQYAWSPYIGEFFNSISSFLMLLTGLFGFIRNLQPSSKLPWQWALSEAIFALVGAGSMWFHSQQTIFGEMLDEIPMLCLACGYYTMIRRMMILNGLKVFAADVATTLVSVVTFVAYFSSQYHGIFVLGFTALLLVGSLYAGQLGPWPFFTFKAPRLAFFVYVFFMVGSKVVWDLERREYNKMTCPESTTSVKFYFHAFWHVGACVSHFTWMSYAAKLHALMQNDNLKKLD